MWNLTIQGERRCCCILHLSQRVRPVAHGCSGVVCGGQWEGSPVRCHRDLFLLPTLQTGRLGVQVSLFTEVEKELNILSHCFLCLPLFLFSLCRIAHFHVCACVTYLFKSFIGLLRVILFFSPPLTTNKENDSNRDQFSKLLFSYFSGLGTKRETKCKLYKLKLISIFLGTQQP